MFSNFEKFQKASVYISVIDLVLGILGFAFYIKIQFFTDHQSLNAIFFIPSHHHISEVAVVEDEDNNDFLLFIIFSVWAGVSLFDALYSILLFEGARKQKLRNCNYWLYFRITAFVITSSLLLIFLIINKGTAIYPSIYISFFSLYRIVGLWIVNSFIHLLRTRKNLIRNIPRIIIIDDEGMHKVASLVSLHSLCQNKS